MTEAPDTIVELWQQIVDKKLQGVLIGAVCTVERFDAAAMRADVQPLIEGQDPDESYKVYPLLTGVPVQYLGTGDYVVVPPYKRGDLVWVTFATYDTAKPLKNQKAQTATSPFALQDACVVGPVAPANTALPESITGKDGLIFAHKDGNAIQQILPNKVVYHFGEETTTIDATGIVTTGKIDADKEVSAFASETAIGLKTHGHQTTMGPTAGKIPGGEP